MPSGATTTRRSPSLTCRTTEEYHRFWHEGHFAEPNWLNHYDAVFGEYYFKAIDDWHNGRRTAVPEAWRIAFDATDKRAVSGYGSLFLGMNAHINRDLPFVLASIGMVKPDGTSRKADHDTVNQFLNRVADGLIPELAASVRSDRRRQQHPADNARRPREFPSDPGVAGERVAERRAARRSAERVSSRARRSEHRDVRGDRREDDQDSDGVQPAVAVQGESPRRVLRGAPLDDAQARTEQEAQTVDASVARVDAEVGAEPQHGLRSPLIRCRNTGRVPG